jgi:Uma2 family endonuclease
MSTITNRLTVDQYDKMVENGILPETNRFELIEGRIVEKDMKGPEHCAAIERARRLIDRLLPADWHTRQEAPVRIPNRRSEPEPDVSVVRGSIDDYTERHPEPADVALVVEVTRTSAAKDRALAKIYGGGAIPAYWIVNLPKRQVEVYQGLAGGRYLAPRILHAGDVVELLIDGRVVGQIPVADALPIGPN